MVKCIYCVVWSIHSDGNHNIGTMFFENEEPCKKCFEKEYNRLVEKIKEHNVPVYSFWEMYKNKTSYPETGNNILLFDMFENTKTITYNEDGVEKISCKIEYYGKAVSDE